jgi:hypothetical protein
MLNHHLRPVQSRELNIGSSLSLHRQMMGSMIHLTGENPIQRPTIKHKNATIPEGRSSQLQHNRRDNKLYYRQTIKHWPVEGLMCVL